MVNIADFVAKQNENFGYTSTNRYKVVMTPPPALVAVEGTSAAAKNLEFYCQSAQLPGYQFMTGDVRRWGYGPVEKRPFSPNYIQAQLIFDVDGNMNNWRYFSDWMNVVLPHDRGTSAGINKKSEYGAFDVYELAYKNDYATDINISIYSMDGTLLQQTVLIEAFPSNINPIPVSWYDTNQVAQFAVFVDYLDWDTV